MSIMNVIRKSLGYEEKEEHPKPQTLTPEFGSTADYDDVPISPEFHYYYEDDEVSEEYEIILIRPKTIDDINYVIDQIIDEKNPVILDLSFLEKESNANFKLATDKINQLRNNYGAESLLLAHTNNKHLIILSPDNISLLKK